MPTIPASTMPRPAGLSGTAVSSEPMRATNTAPEMPSSTSGNPNALTTKNRRIASVIQIAMLSRPRPGSCLRFRAPNTPCSNRS